MGLFNRRAAPPVNADTTAATGTATHEKKGGLFGRRNDAAVPTHNGTKAWNSRPTFGQWFKATWLDIITMIIMGAIGLGVYEADPAPSRSFPGTAATFLFAVHMY
jgi:diacylglycerol diphosphate phosphatase/phosphatidate phosphatase